jgi:hypothetical protein
MSRVGSKGMTNGASNGVVSPLELELEELEPTLGDKHFEDEPQQQRFNPLSTLYTLWLLILAYADYYRGVTAIISAIAIMIATILALEAIASAATSRYHPPKVLHDYTNAQSIYELQMAKIDHWCLQGGDDNCRCDDPCIGLSNEQVSGWMHAHKLNKKLVEQHAWENDLDVVFLGDAPVEEMNGRWLGRDQDEYGAVAHNFQKTFTKAGGGDLNGLALGVAGDTVSSTTDGENDRHFLLYQHVVSSFRFLISFGESNTEKFQEVSIPKFFGS